MKIEMKRWSVIMQMYSAAILIVLVAGCRKESKPEYFESIRGDQAALYDFFQKMPKGGDLHHHAVGAVYAETLLEYALQDSMLISPVSYQLYDSLSQVPKGDSVVLLNELLQRNPNEKDSVIDYWSVRNYIAEGRDGHDWFFASFFKFMPAFEGHEPEALTRLCERAKEDNISYLETMIAVPQADRDLFAITGAMENKIDSINLDTLYANLMANPAMLEVIESNINAIDSFYEQTDKHGVALRFQTYGVRVIPSHNFTFAQLLVAFETAQKSPHVVGVNFLAPEDNAWALTHYDTHMDMFEFFHTRYPGVNISLHSGELVSGKGDVTDKDLTDHIFSAIETGSAVRIGHGVDVAGELQHDQLLRNMSEQHIMVEINLESNEVILERNKENHPIHIYRKFGVPFCISSDDEGVLRTDLTNQYVKLVQYCPELTYDQVREIVMNSIRYSFLNQETKDELTKDLLKRFETFESAIKN